MQARPPVQVRSGRSGRREGAQKLQMTFLPAPHIFLGQGARPTGRNANLVQAFHPSLSYLGSPIERTGNTESRTFPTYTSPSERLRGWLPPTSSTPQGGLGPDPLRHLSPRGQWPRHQAGTTTRLSGREWRLGWLNLAILV